MKYFDLTFDIPPSVNKRLSTISSNEEVFNKAIPPFQQALEKSGYTHKLKFEPQSQTQSSKNNKNTGKRKETYFNPPFSQNVKK